MNLKFGTGGLRAIMGPGPDQMNLGIIQEATLGVAAYAKEISERPRIAIAYDSRNHSREFAKEAARVLALKGCQALIYQKLMPTPSLSFAVRYLQCDLGICITASHNPKEYNGYKVYGSDGGQITGRIANIIRERIEMSNPEEAKDGRSFSDFLTSGKITYIDHGVRDAYLAAIKMHRTRKYLTSGLKVVYTPLNGAGLDCVTRLLYSIGIENLQLVPEQEAADGNFPTCPYPNPEDRKALELGFQWCRRTDADILLATDPDSDRIGVAAKKGNAYEQLTGNQVGVLLLHYLLKRRKETGTLPEKPVIIRTIVTTSMIDKIAEQYHASVLETLTGFKYIGEKIGELEKAGEAERFVFGIEESCGYLGGVYVRDKDAVGAAMLVCEMADAYKAEGKTLWDGLEELYEIYGCYETELKTYKFDGEEASLSMKELRNSLSSNHTVEIEGSSVLKYADYLTGIDGLPKSDVLKVWLENGSTVVIRPSGTEPKLKIYTEKLRKS